MSRVSSADVVCTPSGGGISRGVSVQRRGLQFERLFGPEVPTGDDKHPTSVTELANGDLFVAFFSGKGEYKENAAAVFGSRLKPSSTHWSKPVKIASNLFYALGNAVPWQAPDGVVWLFYVTRDGKIDVIDTSDGRTGVRQAVFTEADVISGAK